MDGIRISSWIVFLTEVFCSICPMVLLAAAVYFLVERRVAVRVCKEEIWLFVMCSWKPKVL